jgi:Phage integrase family
VSVLAIVGHPKMRAKIAKLGGLPADVTPRVLRHGFASLAADVGCNEPTIASLLGHKTHSITSRYMHSADAVLLAGLMVEKSDLGTGSSVTPGSCGIGGEMESVVWDGITSLSDDGGTADRIQG